MSKLAKLVKCPHCGNEQVAYVPAEFYQKPIVILCDSDLHGCDKFYVVIAKVVVEATTHKIEE